MSLLHFSILRRHNIFYAVIKPGSIYIIIAHAGVTSTPQKDRVIAYERVFRTCTLNHIFQNQPNGAASTPRGPKPGPPSLNGSKCFTTGNDSKIPWAIKPLCTFLSQPELTNIHVSSQPVHQIEARPSSQCC